MPRVRMLMIVGLLGAVAGGAWLYAQGGGGVAAMTVARILGNLL